jgi:nicotinate phosphoribosyltransferase
VIDVMKEAPAEMKVSAVRLDSGDLGALARETRRLLDDAGLKAVEIFASSGLDEYEITSLVGTAAPIDGFGVGTGMSVSSDAPALDIAYKLADYDGQGRTKLSRAKPILPGRKQVFRQMTDGKATGDVIGRGGEHLEGEPLLQLVMRAGHRTPAGVTNLEQIRRHAADGLGRLPARIVAMDPAEPPYPVAVTAALERYHADVRAAVTA